MEQQLKEYRARKQKEKNSEPSLLNRLWSRTSKQSASSTAKNDHGEGRLNETGTTTKKSIHVDETLPPVHFESVQEPAEVPDDGRKYLRHCLYVILWFLLWMFFIEVGFGAVYFAVSGFYLMYINTRTGPKDRNRLSAYSVFNKNQERLDGTFTAEQFEKELRFGAGSVR